MTTEDIKTAARDKLLMTRARLDVAARVRGMVRVAERARKSALLAVAIVFGAALVELGLTGPGGWRIAIALMVLAALAAHVAWAVAMGAVYKP